MRKLHYHASRLLTSLLTVINVWLTLAAVRTQDCLSFVTKNGQPVKRLFAALTLLLFMTVSVDAQILCVGDPVPPGPTSCTTANGNTVTTVGNQAVNMTGPLLGCQVFNPFFGGAQVASPPWFGVGVTQTPLPIFPLTPGTTVETRGFFSRFVPFPPFFIFENCVVENIIYGIDVNDPVVFCGPGATAECSADIGAAAVAALVINDCSNTMVVVNSITPDPIDGCSFPLVATVDMTVTDDCGNSTDISCDVTVEDTTPPTIACPADQDRNFDAACEYVMEDFTGLAVLMDNCDDDLDPANIVQTPTAGTVIMGGCGPTIQMVTLEYTDCNGNGPAMCSFNINITDITPPVAVPANCPAPVILNADANCEVTVPDLRMANLFSDGCDPIDPNNIIQTPMQGSVIDVSDLVCADNTIDVSFEYTDCNGNGSVMFTCPDVLDVRDITPPDMLVSCPTPVPVFNLVLDPVTCSYTTVTVPADFFDGLAVVSDNCDDDPIERNDAVVFDCNGLGAQFIDIFGEDCSGNVSGVLGQCEVLIQVNPDDANWNNPGPLCTSDGVVDLNGFVTGEDCGSWSGDIVTVGDMASGGGLFDAAAAGPGAYSVTYTVGNPDCHIELTRTILVDQNFDPQLIDDFAVCWSPDQILDLETLLDAGVPEGGVWTIVSQVATSGGPAAPGITLLPAPGNDHVIRYDGGCLDATIRYTLTDCAGNVESDDIVLTIQAPAEASFDMPSSLCQDEGNFFINNGVRTLNGCNDYIVTFDVISGPDGDDLIGGAPVTGPLAGFPAVVVDPEVAQGRYRIRLTISDPNGICPDAVHEEVINIHRDAMNPNGIGNPGPVCENAVFPLILNVQDPTDEAGNALPAADVRFFGLGVLDGPGITGRFTPPDTDGDGSPGPGTFTVCVNLGDARCLETYCEDIVIENDIEDPDLVGDFDLCVEPDEVIAFSALLDADDLPGGTWSLAGPPTGTLTGTLGPNGLIYEGGCGSATLQYIFADDCAPPAQPAEVTITFNQRPDIDLVTQGPLCVLDAPTIIANNATVPICGSFGTFTGPGITDNADGTATFNPAIAGEGVHTIMYTISTAAGCEASGEVQVVVDAASDANFNLASDLCVDDAVVALTLSNADPSVLGGGSVVLPTEDGNVEVTWEASCGACLTDNGDGTASFDPAAAGPGTFLVCAYTGDPSCQQSHCDLVVVHEGIDAGLVGDLNRGCFDFSQNGPFTDFDLTELYLPGITLGGTWSYVSGAGGAIRNETMSALPGCHQLRYTVEASFAGADGECAMMSDDVFLLLTEEPQPAFDMAEEVCWDGVAGSIQLPTLYNGDTWGDNSTRTYDWTATLSSGAGPVPTIITPTSMEPVVQIEGAGVFEICLTETLTYDACGGQGAGVDCDNQVCHLLSVTETAVEVLPGWTNVGPFCEDDDRVYLGAADAGQGCGQVTGNCDGVFSGTGVVEDPGGSGEYYFDPGVAGPGTHSVCYTVNNGAGCSAVECHNVVVGEEVQINCQDNLTLACATMPLGTQQTFGPFSSSLFGSPFPQTIALQSDYTLGTYELDGLLCANATTGGTWSIVSDPPGSPVGLFNSGAVQGGVLYFTAPGCYTVNYTVESVDGVGGDCIASQNFFVTIGESPNPSFDLPDEVCWSPGVPVLTYDIPNQYLTSPDYENAVTRRYSSSNPAAASVGFISGLVTINGPGTAIICMVEDINTSDCPGFDFTSCQVEVCQTIEVFESSTTVDPSWTEVGPFCTDDARVYLGARELGMGCGQVTGTCDGEFTGQGVIEDPVGSGEYYFDPALITIPGGLTNAIVSVCYTVNNQAGCSATECHNLTVFSPVSADLIGDATLGCQNFNNGFGGPFIYFNLDRVLGANATRGGSWTTTLGSVSGNVLIASPGCTELTYTVSAFDGADGDCVASESMFLRLVENPMPDFDIAEEVCWDGVAGSITLPTLYNGQTFGDNGTRLFDWNATLVSGAGPVPTFSDATIEEPTVTVQGAGVFEICLTESIEYPACGSMPEAEFCAVTTCHTLSITETSIEVIPTWTNVGPLCIDDSRVYLGAAEAGMGCGQVTGNCDGVFTGTGVTEDPGGSGEYYFDPAISGEGQFSVCYTVNNGAGCTATECHIVEVFPEAIIEGEQYTALQCAVKRGPFNFVALPNGATLVSAYNSGQYNLEDLLTGNSKRGGTWTLISTPDRTTPINAPNGEVFGGNLYYTDPGCYEVEYAVSCFPGADGDCVASMRFFVQIGECPTAQFDLPDGFCLEDADLPYTLDIGEYFRETEFHPTSTKRRSYGFTSSDATIVSPASAARTTNADFMPTILTQGTVEICVTEGLDNAPGGTCGTTATFCSQRYCQTITIVSASETLDPSWDPVGPLCIDDDCVDLDDLVTGTMGGVFTGPGVSPDPSNPDYIFCPADAGPGEHIVTYNVVTTEGCESSFSRTIIVTPAANATLQDAQISCEIAPSGAVSLSVLFTPMTTPGGTFSLVGGPASGMVNGGVLLYSEAGCYEIEYDVETFPGADGVCQAVGRAFVLITEQPQPSFDIQDQVCFSDGDPNLNLTPLVNSPTYDAASILSSSWTVTDNVVGALVTIDAMTGVVTVADEAGPATITGTIQVCLTEELDWAACGTITASVPGRDGDGCTETICMMITVEDGTAIDAGFTADNTEPCPGEVVSLTANTSGGVFTGLNVTDNGDGQTASLQIDSCGSYAVTYTVSSPNGCTNSLTLNIGTDRTDPVVIAPNDTIVECDGLGNLTDMQNWLDRVTGSDNCTFSIDTVLFNRLSGCSQFVGSYVYEFVATDTCGNSSRDFGTFTIEDSTPPVITGGADMNMEECIAPPSGNFPEFDFWLSDNAGATAVDGCGGRIFWSNNFDPANWMTICGNSRFVDVTFYAEDECMNVDSVEFRFSIGDATPPVFDNCPRPEITAAAPATWCSAFVNFSPVSATDNCSAVTLTRLDNTGLNSGDLFPVGITVLTWEARDSCDNADTCSLKIIVNDFHTPPTISCPGDTMAVNDPGLCGADVAAQLGVDLSPTEITDNCIDPNVPQQYNNVAVTYEVKNEAGELIGCGIESVNGFVFPVGMSDVTYKVQDQPILLITEIVQDGADAVEVTNFGPSAMEISCLSIERIGNGDEIHIVPIGTILQAGDTYVANLMNDIGYTDPATYTIGIKGTVLDEISTNGGLDGGDIWRTIICDHDSEDDWLVTVECKASLGMINPGLPVFLPNGLKTGIQTVLPSTDECSFKITVDDTEDPVCAMVDTMVYQSIGRQFTGQECVSLTVNIPDNLLIGGVLVSNVNITYPELGDLAASLIGPDGTEVELFNRPCTNVPDMSASFADSGVQMMSNAGCTDPLNNNDLWIPEDAFKAFYGKSAQGDWTLELSVDGVNAGELLGRWSIDIISLMPFDDSPIFAEVDPATAPDDCGTDVTWTHPVLQDNCCSGSMVVEYSTLDADTLPMGGPVMSGAMATEFFGLGTTTVKYTLTDDAGNMTMCSFDVVVEDPLGLCVTCASNCQVSCIQNINVSLNQNCQVPVVASMISENIDDDCNDYYDIEILDHHGNVLPSDTLDASHVGQCWTVRLTEPECGNSCWTEVCVEDKFPPIIECVDDTMSCVEYQYGYDEPTAVEFCGTYTVRRVDEQIKNMECDSMFQKLVIQKWVAEDNYGNVSDTCVQSIWIERFPLNDINRPTEDTSIYCGSGYATDALGNPHPDVTGIPKLGVLPLWPVTDFFCKLSVEYEDIDLGTIGCTQRILRTWKVREWWCRGDDTRTYSQNIYIVDTVGPVLDIGVDTIWAKAGLRSCDALVNLPEAYVLDACYPGTEEIDMVYPGGFADDQNGGQVRLEVGDNVVVYRAFDECYNETTDTVIVVVSDQIAPIAVCEQNTVISLDNDGIVHVYAEAFDDGSFDECKLEKIEVRRMTDNCASGTDVWGDYVEFCCSDLGDTVMVAFRVTDKSGNSGTCMVNAFVQDKLPPVFTPLPDITIDCRYDLDSMFIADAFGTYVFADSLRKPIVIDDPYVAFSGPALDGLVEDNCPPIVKDSIDFGNINNCGEGYLNRHFWFEDLSGNVVHSDVQRITVTNHELFDSTQIIWPVDVDTINVCGANNLRPENLNEAQAFPRFIDESECSLVGYDYKDELIDASVGSEACYKIIRSWTVIDWCQKPNGVHKRWTHDQVLVNINDVAPIITSECNDTVRCVYNADCEPESITLIAEATDFCTNADDLFWKYKIDLDSDGDFDIIETGNDATGIYKIGVHYIKWIVEDRCGNKDSCAYTFELRNCKAPTAYCKSGVVAELVPVDLTGNGQADNKIVEIWASDFDAGSEHPCGHDVVLSFSADTSDKVRYYDCDSIPRGQRVANKDVTIWVTDLVTGEVSRCRTNLQLQDNDMTYDCDDFRTFGGGIISGLLSTEDDGLIRDVMVDLTNSGVPGMMTNDDGEYEFPPMPFGSQYEVIPNKDGDDFNGISTADIVAIQRHLLGKQSLNSPYKLIAADVNKSDFVSAADISELRKFILGLYNELPNNTSWRFVDETYSFPDPMNPWEEIFPETYDITGFDSDMNIDFVGVKIGDVNGDVDLNGFGNNSPRSVRSLKMEDGEISDGNTYEVVLTMEDLAELSGYQFTLEWNTDYLELIEVMPNLALDMRLNNFGLNRIEEGVITTSWNRTNEDRVDQDEERLFVLRFRGLQKGRLSELMTVSSQITKKEAYVGQDFATEDLELDFVGGAENRYFALYQNEPNPWSNRTLISFHLPSDQVASLTIFDENGRAVKTIDGEFTRGHNEVEINQDDLQGSGLLYYRLETRDHTATRKMILIE